MVAWLVFLTIYVVGLLFEIDSLKKRIRKLEQNNG